MSDDGSESEDPYQMCAAAGGDDSGDSAASGGSSGGGGSGGAAAAAAAPARAGAADSDGADDFLPSPPRRKNRARAAGGAPAAGARGKQPKWKRTVMEWEMLPGGEAVLETSLDAFIEAHGRKVAAGVLCSLPAPLATRARARATSAAAVPATRATLAARRPATAVCMRCALHLIRQGLYTEGEVAGFI